MKNTEKEFETEVRIIHKISKRVTLNLRKLISSLNLEDMLFMRMDDPLISPNERISPYLKDIYKMDGVIRSLKIIFKHLIDREIEESLLEFEGEILKGINYQETRLEILKQKIFKLSSIVLKKVASKKKKTNKSGATESERVKNIKELLKEIEKVKNSVESVLKMEPRVTRISQKINKLFHELTILKDKNQTGDSLIQGRFDLIIFTLEQLKQKLEKSNQNFSEFSSKKISNINFF